MNETLDQLHYEILEIAQHKKNNTLLDFSEAHHDRLITISRQLGSITIRDGHSKKLDDCKTKVFLMIEDIEDDK